MSDLLDSLFNQLAPPKEEIAEKPSKSLLERLWDSFDRPPSPSPVKPPVEAVKAPSGHSIDTIFPALIQAESKGVHLDEKGQLIKSKVGAEGISQLMPSTAKKPGYGIEPVKDKSEKEFLRVGKEYLQKMYEKFGDWEKALAAYNAGVGNVMKAEGKAERFGGDWKEHLPKKDETLPYIKKIMSPQDMKPISAAKGTPLAATELKTPRVLEAAGKVAQAAGDTILDLATSAGASVNTGAALATAGEMLADPLNFIPGAKGVAAVGAIASKDFLKLFPDFAKSVVKEPVYHGSVNEIKGSFRLPKEGDRQLGIHFGSKDAANAILNKDSAASNLQHNISEVYLNIKKPLIMEDQGIWRPKFVVEQLEKESLTPQQKQILDQYKRNNPQAKEIYSNTTDQSIRKLLQDMGYDGVQYKNLHEGKADQWSYIVLDPKQIQSAISPTGMKVGAESTVKKGK